MARKFLVGYVIQENGCWDWVGGRTKTGYGVWSGSEKHGYAHRTVYEKLRGPIPDGLELDHLCRNRACVNPDHLEPVTAKENLRRGVGFPGVNARKTHCKHGHEYTEENTRRSRNGGRCCRACGTLRMKQRWIAIKASRISTKEVK